MDKFEELKQNSKKVWANFAPLEHITGTAAPRLVKFSGIDSTHKVLDVACGTGVVGLTAARLGATVIGADITPELIDRARENNSIFNLNVDFHESDVESLPFKNEEFDVVVSQFGHMFAPRPTKAISEMLRVLKPGGTIAFSTWPPELFMGQFFQIITRYGDPLPPDVEPPHLWGNVDIIVSRLKHDVQNIRFDRDKILSPGLSIGHLLKMFEKGAGPLSKLVEKFSTNPDKLKSLRDNILELLSRYFENNYLRQDYLLTKATKN